MENMTAGEAPAIEFESKALAPVALFMAQSDIRYYLNGICVQPNPNGGGCFVIGCDGHRLAIWHDKHGVCTQRTIFKVSKELISASRKKAARDGKVCLEGGRLVVKDKNGEETFIQAGKSEIVMESKDYKGRTVKNHYPDVWRVVPKSNNLVRGMRGAINGRYIEAIGKAAKMFEDGGSWGHSVGVWHFTTKSGKDWGSVLTRFSRAPGFIVITMPMREDGVELSPLPAGFSGQGPVDVSAPATLLHPMGSCGEAI